MKTIAISVILLTTSLNVSILNTDKLSENRILRVVIKENYKETVDKCCVMNLTKEMTNNHTHVKTKPPTTKKKTTNFYDPSYKVGFVIADPILTYSI